MFFNVNVINSFEFSPFLNIVSGRLCSVTYFTPFRFVLWNGRLLTVFFYAPVPAVSFEHKDSSACCTDAVHQVSGEAKENLVKKVYIDLEC